MNLSLLVKHIPDYAQECSQPIKQLLIDIDGSDPLLSDVYTSALTAAFITESTDVITATIGQVVNQLTEIELKRAKHCAVAAKSLNAIGSNPRFVPKKQPLDSRDILPLVAGLAVLGNHQAIGQILATQQSSNCDPSAIQRVLEIAAALAGAAQAMTIEQHIIFKQHIAAA